MYSHVTDHHLKVQPRKNEKHDGSVPATKRTPKTKDERDMSQRPVERQLSCQVRVCQQPTNMDTHKGASWRSHSQADDEDDGALNLTLFGSPAPRCVRQTPRVKEKAMKTSSSSSKGAGHTLTLPVDRIMFLRDRLNDSLGCDFISDDERTLPASSHHGFSLDLSSGGDSAHETESSEGEEKIGPKKQVSSRRRYHACGNSTISSVPSSRRQPPAPKSAVTSSKNSAKRLDTSSSENRKHGKDLICLYVDTVNNTQLAKYFRPCITCKQNICLCRSVVEEEEEENRPESQCSGFSQFLMERRFSDPGSMRNEVPDVVDRTQDSGNSTLQFDETARSRSSVLSPSHVSLSLMQLSTAAQCARILADSLDSILQLAKDEVSSLAASSGRRPITGSRNVDDLQSALDTLQRNYPHALFGQQKASGTNPCPRLPHVQKESQSFTYFANSASSQWGMCQEGASMPENATERGYDEARFITKWGSENGECPNSYVRGEVCERWQAGLPENHGSDDAVDANGGVSSEMHFEDNFCE